MESDIDHNYQDFDDFAHKVFTWLLKAHSKRHFVVTLTLSSTVPCLLLLKLQYTSLD